MDSQPATPDLRLSSDELDDYFASISDSFENTWATSQRHDYVDDLLAVPAFLSILSVIPLVPVLVWKVVHFRHPGWGVAVGGWVVPIHSFLFWWCACVILSVPFTVLSFRVDTWRSKRASKDKLGAASMRFALCYATVQELDRFAKNGLLKHAERALNYWTQLPKRILKMLDVPGGGWGSSALSPDYFAYSAAHSGGTAELAAKNSLTFTEAGDFLIPSLFPEVYYLQQRYAWFKLEPTTSKIMNALCTLPWKITTRLRDRKDVSSVASSVLHFASFLYTLIPEVSSTGRHSDTELAAAGEQSLLRFADSLESLSFYRPESRPLEGKEKVRSKLAMAIAWLVELFVHETPIVKFIVWWALSQAIVIFGLVVAHHYVADLKPDSTLVSLVIGTPLVVSAAALAGAFRNK